MNFLRPLPCLALVAALNAQTLDLKPQGGGSLKIGTTLYRFNLTGLSSAPPKGGLPGAIRLEGRLVAPGSGPGFHMVLTMLNTGALYTMVIERRLPGVYPDNWAINRRTRVQALKLENRPGGRVELRCEGSLAGIIDRRPQDAEWSGTLWAQFPGGGEELNPGLR